MKLKRFTSFILALLMVLNLGVAAFAAETTPVALKLSVDKTEAKIGDTVTVTISSDTEITGIQGWGMDLYLDNTAYKLEESAIYGGNNEILGVVTDNIEKHSSVNISAFDTTDGRLSLMIPNGTLATLTFEVVGETTGAFQLKDIGANLPDDVTNLLVGTSEEVKVVVCSHSWADGVCEKCGKECAHEEYENGACKVCGKAEEAAPAPMTVIVNDEPVEVKFVENGNNQNWYFVSVAGSNFEISGTTENPLKKANNVATTDGKANVSLKDLKAMDISKIPADVAAYAKEDTTQLYVCSFEFTNGTKLPNGQTRGNLFVEMACDHDWQEASCTVGETCSKCGIEKTGSVPAGHKLLGDGTCENCELTVPALSVTANGKPVEVAYTTADSGYAYSGIFYFEIYEDSDIQIVKKDAYTDNYSWAQIKGAYQYTERADGSPAWLDWPDSYKLPVKSNLDDLANMPYFQRRTNSSGTQYDFIVIGVIKHPDHTFVDGECSICGKECDHSWNSETGVCEKCGKECAHEAYENGACKVCGKAEPVVDLSLFNITVNGEDATVYAGMTSKNKLRHGVTISGTTLTITTKDGSVITQVRDATKNRVTGENYLVTNDSSSITIDLLNCSSTDLASSSYDATLAFPFGTDTTIYRLIATVNGASQQIYVEVKCDHENWQEADCSNPEVCLGCGKFGGYPAHKLMGDGTCENCELTVPALSVTANGKPVEVAYTTASSGYAYSGIFYFEIYEGSDIQIVKKDAYTDNYSWTQIRNAYQTTEDMYGNPAWRGWPDSYKLPVKSNLDDLANMPYFQRRTNSAGTQYDFIIMGVIKHPDHTFVDGECTICGKECDHSWTDGECSICGKVCDHSWVDATCEAPKTCSNCGATEGEALGHNWGAASYKWSEDGKVCTATRVCQNDAAHTESAEATVTSEVEKEATCTESGITKYTAAFDDVDWAETQTNSKADIEALDHDMAPATCEEPATCQRDNCGYTEGEALGHDWEVSYVWSKDGKSCTATRVCGNSAEHNVTVEATVTATVAKKATCSAMGDTQYTATFAADCDWAETQVTVRTDIAIDKDAHEWGEWEVVKEASYTEEGSKKRVCENDESHVETETIAKLVPTATEKTEGPDDTKEYVVAYQEGVVMVPAGLENEYPNQQAVKDALKAKVENGDLKGEVNLVFREVTVGYYENGAFVPVSNGEFFENGKTIEILLKYPEGADKNDKFEVYHLRDDGVIEKCVIKEKNDKGLVIEVGSLSPFVIAYESVNNTPSWPSNPGKPSKPSDKPNPGITIITPEDEKEEANPNTGAPVVCSFDLTAAGVVVLAATAAVLEIKRRK